MASKYHSRYARQTLAWTELTAVFFLCPPSPLVIINSVCPGMVHTDIGRQIASRSRIHALLVYLTLVVTAKTPNSGARIILQAALKPKENHVSCRHAYTQ